MPDLLPRLIFFNVTSSSKGAGVTSVIFYFKPINFLFYETTNQWPSLFLGETNIGVM